MQWQYLNGEIVPAPQASISTLDLAVTHGRALVETFAARRGRVFRLDRHYERVCHGAQVLALAVPLELSDLETAVCNVLDCNGITDARLRLTVTAGGDGAGPATILSARPLADYPAELYERGMRATVASVRRNETSPLSRVKSAAGLLDGLIARQRAQEAGFDEAVMLNTRGLVAEATVANIFVVKDDRVATPAVALGALPGVTRGAVLDLAREAGLNAGEGEVTLSEIRAADEAFLTNAIMGVMPLTRLEGGAIGDGRPGPISGRLRRAYRDAAGR
jgi:branched-subunit amino acid aminotransferase/4-amino-4-deoxychorismate lyase